VFAHRAQRAVLRQKFIDAFGVEYMATGELLNDCSSMIEVDKTNVTAGLIVGSSRVTIPSNATSFAPNTGCRPYTALIVASVAS
jgi:hypothetical protein